MCGLAGIFAYSSIAPPVDGGELLRIREAMAFRGPDGAGLWISEDRRIGLAHRRLAVIDTTAAGAQPMSTPDGAFSIVCNGEIYNYRELRGELQSKGYSFVTRSDTEVLLHLYREHGAGMLQRLRGMFAFALWDAKKRGLFLARDPLGIKPLYYSDDGGKIRVASQVKALLAGGAVDNLPDPAGHVGFFLFGYVPDPHTLFKGISALPAGMSMWVDGSGCGSPKPFYDLRETFIYGEKEAPVTDRAEMRHLLREALLDSMRAHLVSDVPVGVFLSSGVDSTTMAALAREVGAEDMRSVTLAFAEYVGRIEDESPLAEKVARKLGTRHETRRVGRKEFEEEYPRILSAMDQPTIDGVNTYFASRAAAGAGLKVAISGLGGDELFEGYPSFVGVPKTVRWLRPVDRLPNLGKAFRVVSAPVLKRFTSPKYAGLLEYGGSYGGAYLLRRGLFMPWELPDILDGDLVRDGWEELKILTRLEETAEGIHSPHMKVSALEMRWYMQGQLLRDSDWAGMAHGLEIRVPLVDAILLKRIAMGLASPVRPTKRDLASVSGKGLPADVVGRRKTGFSIPLKEWLRYEKPSREERGHRPWARKVYKEYCRDCYSASNHSGKKDSAVCL